jgi:hypothetical protein
MALHPEIAGGALSLLRRRSLAKRCANRAIENQTDRQNANRLQGLNEEGRLPRIQSGGVTLKSGRDE